MTDFATNLCNRQIVSTEWRMSGEWLTHVLRGDDHERVRILIGHEAFTEFYCSFYWHGEMYSGLPVFEMGGAEDMYRFHHGIEGDAHWYFTQNGKFNEGVRIPDEGSPSALPPLNGTWVTCTDGSPQQQREIDLLPNLGFLAALKQLRGAVTSITTTAEGLLAAGGTTLEWPRLPKTLDDVSAATAASADLSSREATDILPKGKKLTSGGTIYCANKCGQQGNKRCAGCHAVHYCSAKCQKEHWKSRGHKQQCKILRSAATMVTKLRGDGSSTVVPADAEDSCGICLDSNPPPMHQGCDCRGTSGKAHAACRILEAIYRCEDDPTAEGLWTTCTICHQEFSGEFLLELSAARYVRAFGPDGIFNDDESRSAERLIAGLNWARALRARDLLDISMQVCQELLKRMKGFEYDHLQYDHLQLDHLIRHQIALNYLAAAGTTCPLGTAKNLAEAQAFFKESLKRDQTLSAMANLGKALTLDGKHAEAEKLLRFAPELKDAAKEAQYFQDDATRDAADVLAYALMMQGKYDEADKIMRNNLSTTTRIRGPEHPETLRVAAGVALSLKKQKKYAEAERMYRKTLLALQQVVGETSNLTKHTASNFEEMLQEMRSQ